MTITHDNEFRPILKGPMSKSEFLDELKTRIGNVDFIKGAKSNNPVHPYSHSGEGYIIMQLGPIHPVLYDSVQNPERYMEVTQDWGLVVGRHNRVGDYFMTDVNWESTAEVILIHYRMGLCRGCSNTL